MDPINVLVVDDSLVIRGMLTNIFEADKRLRLVGAVSTAAEADRVIAQQIVDVVTLDVEMPGVNGLDYLVSLARRHIPTIILSSRASEDSEVRSIALSRGASSCFNKANAVRDAAILLHDVVVAAKQGHKGPDAHATTQPVNSVASADTAIEQLVAEHGEGLGRFVAERIGYAVLEEDKPALTKWVCIGRKLRDAHVRAAASSQVLTH